MSPEQNDFQDLRRLLALKRHEQPPPGYFNGFSQQVMGRIRAGERLEKESFFSRLFWETPWLQSLWAALQTKPSVAGAFGVIICSLLVSVVLYSEHGDAGRLAVLPPLEQSTPQAQPLVASQFSANVAPGAEASSINGVVPTAPRSDSLFEEIRHMPQWRLQQGLQAQPVVERIPLGP